MCDPEQHEFVLIKGGVVLQIVASIADTAVLTFIRNNIDTQCRSSQSRPAPDQAFRSYSQVTSEDHPMMVFHSCERASAPMTLY